jgi:phytanoyl-CoA hydroxylase
MSLTSAQIDQFNTQGYLVVENVFSVSEVERLQRACDEIAGLAKGLTASTDRFKLSVFRDSGPFVQQVGDPHEMSGVWLDLVRDSRLLDRVEGLIGPNIQVYYSQLMMKAPRQGFTAPWHQDAAFFPHSRSRILACSVAIDDATIENGCISVIPGSHKLGLINHYNEEGVFTGIVRDQRDFNPATAVSLPAKAGSVLFWHALTLHSSPPNRTDRPRRILVIEYKDPADRLLAGSFNGRAEARNVGYIVRGRDPSHDLLAPL